LAISVCNNALLVPASKLPKNSEFFALCQGLHNPKSWLFIGREEAGQSAAVLYTIMANCRRLGIDPREYLVDVLARLPAMQASEAAELTPAAWQAARQGKTLRQVA